MAKQKGRTVTTRNIPTVDHKIEKDGNVVNIYIYFGSDGSGSGTGGQGKPGNKIIGPGGLPDNKVIGPGGKVEPE